MIRFMELQNELENVTNKLNEKDFRTEIKLADCEFVKWCKTQKQVEELAQANDIDELQALSHWHTYVCQQAINEIFHDYGCAPFIVDKTTKNTIEINGISFQTAILIHKNAENSRDLGSRANKDEQLRYFYRKSKESGFNKPINKIYVLITSADINDYRKNKTNFEAIAEKIFKFVSYYKDKQLNQIDIGDEQKVFADIILV